MRKGTLKTFLKLPLIVDFFSFLYNMIILQVSEKPAIDVLGLIVKGGWVMIPLGILLVYTIYLMIERFLYFNQQNVAPAEKSRRHIELLRTGENHGASQLCTTVKGSWGRIFIHAGSSQSIEEVDQLLSDATNIEIAHYEKGLSSLSLIAGIAPLLGFIGTIIGVITIFFDISVSQDISIAVISEGLYQKMVSSAGGLVVGIISFSSYHIFQQKIDKFTRGIQEHALLVKLAQKESQL
jgi:biopolymer transport protein ExbB